jgi:hypothetical protein
MRNVTHREECLVRSSVCRENSRLDPTHEDYWIDRAIVWHRRAVQAGRGKAVTYEVHDGRMIAKPAK